MTPSFFSSPFWLDVRRTLERAPRFIPGGSSEWVREANVARRLLENRLLCVRQAIDRADGETCRRLRHLLAGLEIETVLAGLLDTLKEAVLIVGASASVGGAKVGLWLLSVMGLAALADFFLEGLPESKLPEFDRQLGGQEAGLNRMTVDEYLKGREAFTNGDAVRDPELARTARADYRENLTIETALALQSEGFSRNEAQAEAIKRASQQMNTLAALHNPDMVAAGRDVISDFGDRSVNSRIGAQWNGGKSSRLNDLDNAAKRISALDRGNTMMNAKLHRCK